MDTGLLLTGSTWCLFCCDISRILKYKVLCGLNGNHFQFGFKHDCVHDSVSIDSGTVCSFGS